MTADEGTTSPITLRRVSQTWWPLAGSWILMGFELPMVSAVIARLANPEVNLAAYGSVIFPLSILIEAPVIMLLAASTALSRDWPSYLLLRRFMFWTGGIFSVIHGVIAFTPLFDLLVGGLIGVPPEVLDPARIGLMITTPWTLAIGIRRFQQGVLIRFGRPRIVVVGTGVRLLANATVCAIGLTVGTIPGTVIAGLSVCCGVISEAVFVGIKVQPVLRGPLRNAAIVKPALTWGALLHFYWPLAVTPAIRLLAMPLTSAALSRMPLALESLAIWPVMGGLVFTMRSLGLAYNEVVVALIDGPGGFSSLRRFVRFLALGTSALLFLIAVTPLSRLWFGGVCGLSPELTSIAVPGLYIALATPAIASLLSWYQGVVVHSRRTRAITEAVTMFLITMGIVLLIGVAHGGITGLYVGLAAGAIGLVVQALWLRMRSRSTLRRIEAAQLAAATAG